jgi:hypothetical protein
MLYHPPTILQRIVGCGSSVMRNGSSIIGDEAMQGSYRWVFF